MTSDVLLGMIVVPVLAALLTPLLGVLARRSASAFVAFAQLGVVALAISGARGAPASLVVGVRGGIVGLHLELALDRAAGLEVLVAALLFAAIGLFSQGFVRGARQATAFFALLLAEQAAVNLVLLASDLVALYVGLLLLSFSLTLMLGLDFAATGRSAALRVLATLEVPAAVALASIWLIDARAGTVALSDLPRLAPWLGRPSSLILLLPLVVALLSRAALVPFQQWVVVGCRSAAAPVAVSIAGVVVPLGGIALTRVVGAVSLDPTWLQGLAALGALTALVAALGALRETTALGWLGYAAVAQAGFAALGFAGATPDRQAAGWLILVSGALALTLAGFGLALVARAHRGSHRVGLARFPGSLAASLAFGIGLLALAPLPSLPTFTARHLLLRSLLLEPPGGTLALAVLVVVATFLLAVSVWRCARGTSDAIAADAGPARWTTRAGTSSLRIAGREPANGDADTAPSVDAALVGLATLTVLLGILPLGWIVPATGLDRLLSIPAAGSLADVGVTALDSLTIVAALGTAVVWERLAYRVQPPKGMQHWLRWLDRRIPFRQASDPYVVVGALVLGLGRASAVLLSQTLGRLVRAS